MHSKKNCIISLMLYNDLLYHSFCFKPLNLPVHLVNLDVIVDPVLMKRDYVISPMTVEIILMKRK